MPELPNIKLEILEYIYEESDEQNRPVHLRDTPLTNQYGESRIARKVIETSIKHGVFNWGINALHPWIEDEQAVRAAIRAERRLNNGEG